MGKLRDKVNRKLKEKTQEESRKKEVRIYDSEKQEHYYPSERRAAEAKKAALIGLKQRSDVGNMDNAILKSMSDRVNNSEGEERKKAQKRLDKFRTSMSKKD